MKKKELSLNFLFSDGMVLQRDKELRVWGSAKPGTQVQVCLTDETGKRICEGRARADEAGDWTAVLPPQQAAGDLTLAATSGDERVQAHDVAVGEVWIAGGQSNMEFAMRYDADFAEEKNVCENALIRFFDTPRICCEGQMEAFDYREYGCWKPCDGAHLEYFSAVGYYFARKLVGELNVPVGIVGCNRGGSIAAAWMDEESVKEHGQAWLDDYSAYTPDVCERERRAFLDSVFANTATPFADPFSDEMMYGMSRERQLDMMKHMPPGDGALPRFDNRPGCLYEHMLRKIIPYTARGVIWYQGESDADHPDLYSELFLDLVRLWRREWNDALPFLAVQLAPFGEWLECTGVDYPIVRSQQRQAEEKGDHVYLVSSSDVGMRYDIHPKKKAPIGHRLALCALAEIYGKGNAWRAPVGTEAVYKDGVLSIEFSDGEGLSIEGDTLQAFALERADGTVCGQEAGSPLQITASGSSLLAEGLALTPGEKCTVRFAQTGYYEVNLYNAAGIPAMPFVLPVRYASEA